MKTCFRCGKTKPLTEFYPHKAMKDGLLGKCKDCTKLEVSARYKAKRPPRLPNWQPGSEPQQPGARRAVSNAIRDGKLARQPCEICDNPAAEAHHDDYSRPLEVRWLCPPHHKQLHYYHRHVIALELF